MTKILPSTPAAAISGYTKLSPLRRFQEYNRKRRDISRMRPLVNWAGVVVVHLMGRGIIKDRELIRELLYCPMFKTLPNNIPNGIDRIAQIPIATICLLLTPIVQGARLVAAIVSLIKGKIVLASRSVYRNIYRIWYGEDLTDVQHE